MKNLCDICSIINCKVKNKDKCIFVSDCKVYQKIKVKNDRM